MKTKTINALIEIVFVVFVDDNATMSSIWYFENHATYFVQNRGKQALWNSIPIITISVSTTLKYITNN